ncbi:hypothetical protein DUT91_23770 [Phyllobacterium salinisoli]|uniref:Uncharacterized protein n=1 Tax=Phyllobacterium salinisoli TaxID=1899321 RepID=A0A368K0K1_9HYPH|nr:hypothetical protein DUT91_23770 [Phyllobacterium salinisoli]
MHGFSPFFPRSGLPVPQGAGAPLLLPCSRRSGRREGGNKQNRRDHPPEGPAKIRACGSSRQVLHK